VVSIDRSLLIKGRGAELAADFTHPLSCRRPVKFLHHLVVSLGINSIVAMSDINIRSAMCITNTDKDTNNFTNKDTDMDTDKDTYKDTDKDTDKYTDKDSYKDTDKNKDTDRVTDTDMDMDLELKLEFFCQISMERKSP
jgi:hypothetical protein